MKTYTPQEVASRLDITINKAQSLMAWAKRKATSMSIQSHTTKTFYLEHDEWDSKFGVDINYYIGEDSVLKIIAYPIDETGQVDTDSSREIVLTRTKVKATA